MRKKLGLKSELIRRHNQDDGSCEDNGQATDHLTLDVADPMVTAGAANLKIKLTWDNAIKMRKQRWIESSSLTNKIARKGGVRGDFIRTLFIVMETSDNAMILVSVAKKIVL